VLLKTGDPAALWLNYRPIAVVNLLAKLYASTLNDRFTAWARRPPAGSGRPCRRRPG